MGRAIKIRRCEIEGCEKKHFGLGYCRSHHSQFKRGVLGTVRRYDSSKGCSMEGCDDKHYAKDLCKKHWEQQRRGRLGVTNGYKFKKITQRGD